jgi:hypothetical protein
MKSTLAIRGSVQAVNLAIERINKITSVCRRTCLILQHSCCIKCIERWQVHALFGTSVEWWRGFQSLATITKANSAIFPTRQINPGDVCSKGKVPYHVSNAQPSSEKWYWECLRDVDMLETRVPPVFKRLFADIPFWDQSYGERSQ